MNLGPQGHRFTLYREGAHHFRPTGYRGFGTPQEAADSERERLLRTANEKWVVYEQAKADLDLFDATVGPALKRANASEKARQGRQARAASEAKP